MITDEQILEIADKYTRWNLVLQEYNLIDKDDIVEIVRLCFELNEKVKQNEN